MPRYFHEGKGGVCTRRVFRERLMNPDKRVQLNRLRILYLIDQLANHLSQRNVQAELFVVRGGAIMLA
jgi:hypothetical protein